MTYEEYKNIKIDGVSLNLINSTNGDYNNLNQLFNTTFQYDEDDSIEPYKEVKNINLLISFGENANQSSYEISGIKVLSEMVNVTILNKMISIGSTIDSLGNFNNTGTGTVVYKIPSNSNQFLLTHESYLSIKFDESTRKINKIELVILS